MPRDTEAGMAPATHETTGVDLDAVAEGLRRTAAALSPAAAPMAGWLRQRADQLGAGCSALTKALAAYRALPSYDDDRVRVVMFAVRGYLVDQAVDGVLAVADELEELARALLADGDRQLAWAFCELADRIDEGLLKAVEEHPGQALLPSKLNPRVKRWQRVTTVNAADTPGDADGRVAPEKDWADRHRATLRALQELLDDQLERNTGRKPRGRHRRGVGVYQGSTEATSLSQYPDPDGKVFEKGLGAIAAVGLAYRQKEVFLNREFPADCEDEAQVLASRIGGDVVATMAVGIKAAPEEVLASIRRFAGDHDVPGMTLLRSEHGLTEVRFLLFDKEKPRIAALLEELSGTVTLREVSYGWSVSKVTGNYNDLAKATADHRDNLGDHGYSKREIARLEAGGEP